MARQPLISAGKTIAMALQTDGKIVLAGFSMNGSAADFSVARLTATGALDNNFDGDGKNMISIGAMDDIAKGVALKTDGKIILGGYSFNGTDNDAAVVRLGGCIEGGYCYPFTIR